MLHLYADGSLTSGAMRRPVLLAFALVAAMSACGGGDDSPKPRADDGLANGFAMVLAESPPPCPADPAMELDQAEEQCYALETEALVPMDDVLESATAEISPAGDWQVLLTLTDTGIEHFNELAASCFDADIRCPTGRIAITAGGDVVSAPQVQEPAFERDQIVVVGEFDEDEARQLADAFDPGGA